MYAIKSCYLKANHTILLSDRVAVKWSPSQDRITSTSLAAGLVSHRRLQTVFLGLNLTSFCASCFHIFKYLERCKKKRKISWHMKTNWYLYLSLNKVLLKRLPFSSMCLLSVPMTAWPWQSWVVLTGKIRSVKLKMFANCPFIEVC